MKIAYVDETVSGKKSEIIEFEIDQEEISIADLIKFRVEIEVEKYNSKTNSTFRGLVQPTDMELTLNGEPPRKIVDAEKQTYIALNAFQNNAFFILIDNKQYTDLNEKLVLSQNAVISFIKLTPLVGG